MYDDDFLRVEEERLGRFIRETLKQFHDKEKADRIAWCKAHGQSCGDCSIECSAREVD